MLRLRNLVVRTLVAGALGLASVGMLVPSDASASVSISVPFEALVRDADAVALVTPGEQKSVWEDGRIYTYTKVKVDQGVAGSAAAGADGWVRTRGGVVGQVGQLVDGEPVFVKDKPSLLFLRKFDKNDLYEVTARAQGQYPVVIDEKTKARKIIRSNAVGLLLPPKGAAAKALLEGSSSPSGSAVQPQSQTSKITDAPAIKLAQEILHDRLVDDVAKEIATEWKRLHPAATPTK